MRRDDAVRVRGAAAVDPGEGEVRLSARVVHLHLDTLRALRVGGGARESHRTQLARRPVGGGPGREGGVPPAPQGANERESVRVITRKAPRARSGQPVGVVHKLAVAAPVPHRQLRKVLLRRRRGVRARAIRPPPQPLAPRALPAGRDCGPRRRGQAVVHHRVRELVREDAPPAVARVRLGSEQVLLAARGLQPPARGLLACELTCMLFPWCSVVLWRKACSPPMPRDRSSRVICEAGRSRRRRRSSSGDSAVRSRPTDSASSCASSSSATSPGKAPRTPRRCRCSGRSVVTWREPMR
mmetsp:Transcript_29054/g.93110  ORF Transcript_29054/g.93110 Transcript_29054/m.93110 type:complete len:298 (-) Transcript_29054:546-1439(-)